tara:strand:+ start:54 stop:779 length:726 start_codon:yes stop_codon:yes gene_type:complete
MINFCVSLTTLPSRVSSIKKTIDSIKKQSLKADKIFLNLPYKFKRFPNYSFNENQISVLEKLGIEIVRCEDYGPSTKLMGSLNHIKDFDCVIILDDDHIYQKDIFEIFINEFKKNKNNFSYYVQKVFELNMGQGADCILINTKDLNKIENFYRVYVKNNKNLFLNDDLWISIYLQFIANNKIINLSDLYKNKTNKDIVYEKHSNIDSLKDVIKKGILNRRKIAKLEYLKFKVKNYFRSLIH